MEYIETVLSVIGAISVAVGIVRFIWMFSKSGTEWIDNLTIKVEDYDAEKDYDEYFAFHGNEVYPVIKNYLESDGDEATVNFFTPQSSVIHNLKIKKLTAKSISSDKPKYKTVDTVKQIAPDSPLCLIVNRREAIAQYMIEWRTIYGGKASYWFYSNLRDSAYNKSGIMYSYSFWSRIRKYFGLV